jgi:hypothetical protein
MDIQSLVLASDSETQEHTIFWQSPFEIRNNCSDPPRWEDGTGEIYNIDRITIVGKKYFYGKFAEKVKGSVQKNIPWIQVFFLNSPIGKSQINPYMLCSTFIKNRSIRSLQDGYVKSLSKNIPLKDLAFNVRFSQATAKALETTYNYVEFLPEKKHKDELEQTETIIKWMASPDYQLITKIPQIIIEPYLMVEYDGQSYEEAEDILNQSKKSLVG